MTAFHAAYTCWPPASRSYHPVVVGGISAFICWDTFTYFACQYLQSMAALASKEWPPSVRGFNGYALMRLTMPGVECNLTGNETAWMHFTSRGNSLT